MECLGWLPGSCVPHYDGEAERRPVYHHLLQEDRILPGIALDDGALAHYVDTHLNGIVTSRESSRAYTVSKEGETVTEKVLPHTWLGRGDKP
jgi:hypothetical protein